MVIYIAIYFRLFNKFFFFFVNSNVQVSHLAIRFYSSVFISTIWFVLMLYWFLFSYIYFFFRLWACYVAYKFITFLLITHLTFIYLFILIFILISYYFSLNFTQSVPYFVLHKYFLSLFIDPFIFYPSKLFISYNFLFIIHILIWSRFNVFLSYFLFYYHLLVHSHSCLLPEHIYLISNINPTYLLQFFFVWLFDWLFVCYLIIITSSPAFPRSPSPAFMSPYYHIYLFYISYMFTWSRNFTCFRIHVTWSNLPHVRHLYVHLLSCLSFPNEFTCLT